MKKQQPKIINFFKIAKHVAGNTIKSLRKNRHNVQNKYRFIVSSFHKKNRSKRARDYIHNIGDKVRKYHKDYHLCHISKVNGSNPLRSVKDSVNSFIICYLYGCSNKKILAITVKRL